jgi:hypothetical protein
MANNKEFVIAIQKMLKHLNIYTGKIDGIYAQHSRHSVEVFQTFYKQEEHEKKHDYTVPLKIDGIVGKETLLAMDEAEVNGWKYNPKTVSLKVSHENAIPYKIRFITKEGKEVDKVVISCNEEKYEPSYAFNPDELYVLSIDQNLEGHIIIDSIMDQEVRYEIQRDKKMYSFIHEIPPVSVFSPINYSDKFTRLNIQNEPQMPVLLNLKGQSKSAIVLGDEFLLNRANGSYTITDYMYSEFKPLLDDTATSAVLMGVLADSSQGAWDTKKIFRTMVGQRFKIITTTNNIRMMILVGNWNLIAVHIRTNHVRFMKERVLSPYKVPNIKMPTIPKNIKMFTVSIKDGASKVANSVKGSSITIIIGIAISGYNTFMSEAKDENGNLKRTEDWTDFLTEAFTGISKAVVSAVAASAVVVVTMKIAAITLLALASYTLVIPAIIVFVSGVLISIGISVFLNYMDEEYQITSKLKSWVNEQEEIFYRKAEAMKYLVQDTYNDGKKIIKETDEYIDNRIDDAIQFFKTQNTLHNYELIHGRTR